MTDQKEQTKAGATELNEEELDDVQGGQGIEKGDPLGKKADKVTPRTKNFSFGVE